MCQRPAGGEGQQVEQRRWGKYCSDKERKAPPLRAGPEEFCQDSTGIVWLGILTEQLARFARQGGDLSSSRSPLLQLELGDSQAPLALCRE